MVPTTYNRAKVLTIQDVKVRTDLPGVSPHFKKITIDADGREVRFSPEKWDNQIKTGDTVDLVVMERDCAFSEDTLEGMSVTRL